MIIYLQFTKTDHRGEIIMVTDQERLDSWLKLAREIDEIGRNPAVLAQVPEIVERLNVGLEGLSVLAPHAKSQTEIEFQAVFCYKPEVFNSSLRIYPFFLEDLASGWDGFNTTGLVTGNSYTEYWRPINQITFNAQPDETLRAMACMFIHELGHALAAQKSGHTFSYLASPLSERIDEEISMRSFDCKLFLALGGPAYRQECDRGIYWTFKHRRQRKMKPDNWLDYFKGKGSVFSPFLGQPTIERVALERDSLFRILCDFMAADRHLDPVSAMKFKQKILPEFAVNLR
ncbi:MAG: hypothetical protein ABSA74_01600 [Candidatus Staskawiczbacteria bacterium]